MASPKDYYKAVVTFLGEIILLGWLLLRGNRLDFHDRTVPAAG